MNVKVDELMVPGVMTASPHQTLGHVRHVMSDHGVSSMPVVDSGGEPVGMVTAKELLANDHSESTPVSHVMSTPVYTVPRYSDPSLAARIMRNHGIHHVLVTEDKRVVGILSSFDLLRLVEDKRFVAKGAPTASRRHAGSRKKAERG